MKYGFVYLAILVALFLRFFIISPYQVSTMNMSPTLITGDYVLVWKNEYNLRSPFSNAVRPIRHPKKGELVVYTQNSKVLIRRVTALPQEMIELKPSSTSQTAQSTPSELTKQKLELNQFLVVSDSEASVQDPHAFEIIQFDQIIGKPMLIWMSYGSTQDFISEDKGFRWNRILTKPL